MLTFVLAAAIGFESPQASVEISEAFTLRLDCVGDATYQTQERSTGFVSSGSDSGFGAFNSNRRVTTEEEFKVEITGSEGRIQYPRIMLPGMNRGDDAGWFEFTELEVGEREITARMRFNVVAGGRITINRANGALNISYMGGGVTGACQLAPEEPEDLLF